MVPGTAGLICLQAYGGSICKLNGLCSPMEAGVAKPSGLQAPQAEGCLFS